MLLAGSIGSPIAACSPQTSPSFTIFQDVFNAEYLLDVNVRRLDVFILTRESGHQFEMNGFYVHVNRVVRGPDGFDPSSAILLTGHPPGMIEFRGRAVISLADQTAYQNQDWFAPLQSTTSWPIFVLGPCGSDIFAPANLNQSNGVRGAMILELFDGDGDPRIEALVFDRLWRGQGGAPIPEPRLPLAPVDSPRPPIRP